MAALSVPSPNLCCLLQEDPELAEALEPSVRAAALDSVVVQELRVGTGPWRNRRMAAMDEGLGLLVLDGVMLHRVGIDRRFGAELLGEGGVLRPPYRPGESTLTTTNDWLVLKSVRLAVLDEQFVRQLAEFPPLAGRLFRRAVERSRQLAVKVLSDLVAARRPTVTSALSDLSRRGEVRSVPEGWLLSGEPPSSARPGANPRIA